jgi:XTP/dITP diphosphohydrolase
MDVVSKGVVFRMKLLISTRNEHKLKEIRQILSLPGIDILDLSAFPQAPEVEEDLDTFEGNAIKKAMVLAEFTGLWTLADDSGLEVDALDGAPGVWSARYAGEPVSHAANNRKLLGELSDADDRGAQFRCVIALVLPGDAPRTVMGLCRGRIATELHGQAGFGYDPVFVPDGETRTFAQMTDDEKNAISHRGRALAAAREAWASILSVG